MNSPQHWSLSEHENLEKATVLRNNLTRFNLQSGEIGPGDDHTSDSLVESLDWDGVASFVGTRTASNCKREWTVNRLPLLQGLADRPFSNTELEDLKWAERHWRGRHWDEIAVYVGNGRRPIECLREYQAKLNLEHMRPWTKEEDRALVNAVTNDPPQRGQWGKIALLFVGRTVPQCRSRWNSLTHSEKTGTWTQDEDEQLKTAVVRHGRGDWVQVAKHVEGRSAHQCRERYERRLKLGVRRKWRVEDYEKLRHLVMTPGARLEWSRLAESMQTSGPHVRDIYATLKKKGYFQEPPASAALTYVAKKDAAAKNC
ncbi:hypothetical protein DFJ77DRAFT_431336 [Powellomyces hirtus]|nr:hypothetical protein DFJ77DRAFT_431336 [Powellomyces hirtus]